MAFAKLYGDDDTQVLVKLDEGDDGPEVRFFFKPEGLGVCSIALSFGESETSWDAAEKAFAAIDEDSARAIAAKAAAEIAGFAGSGSDEEAVGDGC